MESKEWDGEGVPPIGTACEYYCTDRGKWRKCTIVSHYLGSVVAVDKFDVSAVLLHAGLFRPIKTPEQIAEEDRLHAIGEMLALVHSGYTYIDVMMTLYDAGYRKTEVKK